MKSVCSKSAVRTPGDALVYVAECNLATIQGMAMTKTRKKGEYTRQISIAQTAVDWIAGMKLPLPQSGRVVEVLNKHGGSVKQWLTQYDVLIPTK